jgi:hypothetical protein
LLEEPENLGTAVGAVGMWTDRRSSSVGRPPRSQVGWGNHRLPVPRRPAAPRPAPSVPRLSTGRPHVVPRPWPLTTPAAGRGP